MCADDSIGGFVDQDFETGMSFIDSPGGIPALRVAECLSESNSSGNSLFLSKADGRQRRDSKRDCRNRTCIGFLAITMEQICRNDSSFVSGDRCQCRITACSRVAG